MKLTTTTKLWINKVSCNYPFEAVLAILLIAAAVAYAK